MTEHLHYGVTETGLEIVAPKLVVDSATSRHGAMLDEARMPLTKRLLDRIYSPDGQDVTLAFDLSKVGQSGEEALREGRARTVLGLLYQIDRVAHAENAQDPRISLLHSGAQVFDRHDNDRGMMDIFGVSFDRPDDTDSELTRISQAATARYAHLDGLYPMRQDASENVRTSFDRLKGFHIEAHKSGVRGGLTVLGTDDATYSVTSERIHAQSTDRQPVARARLAAFMGVVAMLSDQELFRTEALKDEGRPKEVERAEAVSPEMRRLAGNVSRVAEVHGSRDVDYLPDTLYWGQPDGRFRVMLSHREGMTDQSQGVIPASLSFSVYERYMTETVKTSLEFKFNDPRKLGLITMADSLSVALLRVVRDDATGQLMPAEELNVGKNTASNFTEVLRALVDQIELRSRATYRYDRQQGKKLVHYEGDPERGGSEVSRIQTSIEQLLRQIDT